MLSVPMNKVNGKQQQMVTGSRLKILRKSQKEILEIKTTIIEMKNAFDGLNTDEYRISEPEDVSIKSFKMKRKEKKDFKI